MISRVKVKSSKVNDSNEGQKEEKKNYMTDVINRGLFSYSPQMAYDSGKIGY